MDSIKEFDSGLLICPICGANNMGGFKKWISRIQINNNAQIIDTFILYESETNCICCCLCSSGKEISKNGNAVLVQENTEIRDIKPETNLNIASNIPNQENKIKCYEYFLGFLCLLIVLLLELICYPLFGIWCDLCNCCCHIAKKYKNLRCYDKKLKKVVTYENICYSDIWEHIDGMTVDTINKDKISICLNCKSEKDFLDFLPKEKQYKLRSQRKPNNDIDSKDNIINNNFNQRFDDDVTTNKSYESTNKNIRNKVDMKNIISINFCSQALNINYNMPCLNTILFSTCLEKLYKEYPEIRGKKIYCLANGTKVEENKTMLENKIKSGTTILIYDDSTYINSNQINS